MIGNLTGHKMRRKSLSNAERQADVAAYALRRLLVELWAKIPQGRLKL